MRSERGEGAKRVTLGELRSKDPQIIGDVYRRKLPELVRIAAKVVPGDEAEDIAQDAFLKVYERANSEDPMDDKNLDGYFTRAAKTTAIDYVRRGGILRRKLGTGVSFESIKEEYNPYLADQNYENLSSDYDEERRLFKKIKEVVGHDGISEALILEYYGLSYQEIADTLDVGIGTIRSRIHRGRKRLKDSIEEVIPDYESNAPRTIYSKDIEEPTTREQAQSPDPFAEADEMDDNESDLPQ